MAPAGSKKGSKASAVTARDRRSSSRQSTPLSAAADTAPPTPLAGTPTSAAPALTPAPPSNLPKDTAYIKTPTASLISTEASIEALIVKSNAKANDPPSAKELHLLHDRIRDSVHAFMNKRSEVCDRSMRQLAQKRKERVQAEQEEKFRAREEEEEKARKVVAKKKSGGGRKRSAEEMMMEGVKEGIEDGERMDGVPSVGAHGLARQDGVGVHEGMFASLQSRSRDVLGGVSFTAMWTVTL